MRALALAVLLLASCGSDGKGGADVCEPCGVATDCGSGVCGRFGERDLRCSFASEPTCCITWDGVDDYRPYDCDTGLLLTSSGGVWH